MDEPLPSYAAATAPNLWSIISSYVHSADLGCCALVCRQWHAIFNPRLWGNPASHFRNHDDSVYVALTQFLRTLHWADLSLRRLTHTLHLPYGHAEQYAGPNDEWLKNILYRLPNLQCLIVAGASFFDHAALLALRYQPATSSVTSNTQTTIFNLRLLDASQCFNVTSTALLEGLTHMPKLVYLDLSHCLAAKDRTVLTKVSRLTDLRILGLRSVGLNDEHVEALSSALAFRIKSLDIRDNSLTNASANSLVRHCLRKSSQEHSRDTSSRAARLLWETTNSFEHYVRLQLSSNQPDLAAVQTTVEDGLTHLYVSGNRLTSEGAKIILSSENLNVLDFGSFVSQISARTNFVTALSPKAIEDQPEPEDLVSLAATYTSLGLAYLRIDHKFVTEKCDRSIIEAHLIADDSEPPPYGGISELQDKYANVSGELNDHLSQDVDEFHSKLPNAHESLTMQSVDASLSCNNARTELNNDQNSQVKPRRRSFSDIRRQRENILRSQQQYSHYFTPAMSPRLRTLVLTNVPAHTKDNGILTRLTTFIRQCAQQADLARQEAQVAYALVPGRSRIAAEYEYAKSLFALDRIVLEVSQRQENIEVESAVASPKGQYFRSSTGDTDGEVFWTESDKDFSFFADDDEGGIPASKWSSPTSLANRSRLSANNASNTIQEPQQPTVTPAPVSQKPQIDVIGSLSSFRRAEKLAFMSRTERQAGRAQSFLRSQREHFLCDEEVGEPLSIGTSGMHAYWEGRIDVVRDGPGLS